MNFAPPRIEEIATIDFRLEQRPWPFAIDSAREIDAHWAELLKSNPHHYNGWVLLMHRLDVVATAARRRLEGGCFIAEYKAFLAWRDFGFPDRTISNVFAMAALRSADGAFLLGEMGRSTANAGQIYFPAGTPEPGDLVGEAVDLQSSVLRELEEETGIGADEIALAPGWTVVFQGPRVACMKTVSSALSGTELVARGAAFIAREKRPELASLKVVFGFQDLDEKRMPDFVLTYLRHALARKA
jgi:8-oxo-dGTP pyrophosphatase MutT (NUDIX family)